MIELGSALGHGLMSQAFQDLSTRKTCLLLITSKVCGNPEQSKSSSKESETGVLKVGDVFKQMWSARATLSEGSQCSEGS